MTTKKMPLWVDILLSLWVIVVALVSFGPLAASWVGAARLGQAIGAWTEPASLTYLLMLVVAVIVGALRFLRQRS